MSVERYFLHGHTEKQYSGLLSTFDYGETSFQSISMSLLVESGCLKSILDTDEPKNNPIQLSFNLPGLPNLPLSSNCRGIDSGTYTALNSRASSYSPVTENPRIHLPRNLYRSDATRLNENFQLNDVFGRDTRVDICENYSAGEQNLNFPNKIPRIIEFESKDIRDKHRSSGWITRMPSMTLSVSREFQNHNVEYCCIIRRPSNILLPEGERALTMHNNDQYVNDRVENLDFKIYGEPEDICRVPWNEHEQLESRRIVRIRRHQEGSKLRAYFLVAITSGSVMSSEIGDQDYLEVSCIKYIHKDGLKDELLITSIDMIRIIEFLICTKNLGNLAWRRQERGRIRSNLYPFWHRSCSNTGGPHDEEMHHHLARQLQTYKTRKPFRILKCMRFLSWSNLERAIFKALLFYCVCMSERDVLAYIVRS